MLNLSRSPTGHVRNEPAELRWTSCVFTWLGIGCTTFISAVIFKFDLFTTRFKMILLKRAVSVGPLLGALAAQVWLSFSGDFLPAVIMCLGCLGHIGWILLITNEVRPRQKNSMPNNFRAVKFL